MSEAIAIQLAVEATKALVAAFGEHSAATREAAKAMLELAQAIREHGQTQDVEDEDGIQARYMDGTPIRS